MNPFKVTRRTGEVFVVLSTEDWEREQVTLYLIQNQSLTRQIAASLDTHNNDRGCQPADEQLNEIIGL